MWLLNAIHRLRKGRKRQLHEDELHERPVVRVTTARRPRRCLAFSSFDQQQPSNKSSHDNYPPPPLLFVLTRSWAWEAVNFRYQTHPEEAKCAYQEELSGDTALHVMVTARRPPASTVQLLAPYCAHISNHQGHYPLHAACSYRAPPDVLRVLLQTFPEAANRAAEDGSYPIHLYCDSTSSSSWDVESVDCLKLLLQRTSPEILWKRDKLYQQRPLEILNARGRNLRGNERLQRLRTLRTRQRQTRAIQHVDWREYGDLQQELYQRYEDEIQEIVRTDLYWKKVCLLLVAEVLATTTTGNSDFLSVDSSPEKGERGILLVQDDPSPQQILWALCTHPDTCPFPWQEYAVLLYEPWLLEPIAPHQRLALHVLALQPPNDNHHLKKQELLHHLLTACPEAASVRDAYGKLPLDYELSAADGPHDCVTPLLEANPRAVTSSSQAISQLFPHVFPSQLSVNAIYTIVRADPNLLQLQKNE